MPQFLATEIGEDDEPPIGVISSRDLIDYVASLILERADVGDREDCVELRLEQPAHSLALS
jgi:hypothetical protein